MKITLHKANTRGLTEYRWLRSYHSFSFANFYNPERIRFGTLRVLNDDTVSKGRGFGKHPHDNMEIITIPLEGDLEHKDSMGNRTVIKEGDVQVMSAGTGIFHSEYNKNPNKEVKFLQIWVIPNKKDVKPRYDQVTIRDIEKENTFYQILSPNPDDQGVWIHQDAWFYMGKFDQESGGVYNVHKKGNGIYIFNLNGTFEIDGQELLEKDGLGIEEVNEFHFNASADSRALLIEVPMSI